MTTEELLRLAREQRIVLQDRGQRVAIWAPNQRVNQQLRRAFREQSPSILAHIRHATVYACPSPDLHRQYWMYSDRVFTCAACRRLALACAS